jgi:hypothetical protein
MGDIVIQVSRQAKRDNYGSDQYRNEDKYIPHNSPFMIKSAMDLLGLLSSIGLT